MNYFRIIFLITLLIELIFAACNPPGQQSKLKLWYDAPAADWIEALPIGNGRLGAMVFGIPDQENIRLNEETLWSGGPHRNDNPDARGILTVAEGTNENSF